MPSHAGFVVAAYAVAATVLGGMVAAVLLDGRALRRALSRFKTDRDRPDGVDP